MNVFDAFRHQVRHQPTAPAICAPGTQFNLVSYGRLDALANNVARRALETGLTGGDIVAIRCADSVLHWALILGLARIGTITLSTIDPMLPAECRIAATLTDTPGAFQNGGRIVPVDPAWTHGDGRPPATVPEPGHDDIARIILTSGTTGHAKAVALRHDMIIHRLQAYDVAFGSRIPACTRTFVDVGISANIGFLLGLYMLSRGGMLLLRGSDAATTLQAFTLYDAQCMVASPGGLAEFLDYYERSPAFSPPFEALLSVGSYLSKPLADRLRASICSHVVSAYGATECSPVASAPAHHISGTPGAVGYVAPGITIETTTPDGRVLAAGSEGLIRYRGHTCVAGYMGNPPGSEALFRDGWFYPGDIGRVTTDGMLVISGREKAIIDLGGDKISPDAIEAALLAFPGVVHAAAFGRPNTLGIEEVWVAFTSHGTLNADAIRAHCMRMLPAAQVPARIFQVPDIPRNAAGKIDRRKLLELGQSA